MSGIIRKILKILRFLIRIFFDIFRLNSINLTRFTHFSSKIVFQENL